MGEPLGEAGPALGDDLPAVRQPVAGLAAPQPLVAEITGAAVGSLQLVPGVRVTASWKATATRLVSL